MDFNLIDFFEKSIEKYIIPNIKERKDKIGNTHQLFDEVNYVRASEGNKNTMTIFGTKGPSQYNIFQMKIEQKDSRDKIESNIVVKTWKKEEIYNLEHIKLKKQSGQNDYAKLKHILPLDQYSNYLTTAENFNPHALSIEFNSKLCIDILISYFMHCTNSIVRTHSLGPNLKLKSIKVECDEIAKIFTLEEAVCLKEASQSSVQHDCRHSL